MRSKLYHLPFIGMLFFVVACSNSSSQTDDLYTDSESDILSDADFIVDGDDDLFLDSDLDFDPLTDDYEDDYALFEDDYEQEYVEETAAVETQPVISDEFAPGIGEYEVQRGDTLLLIAFNLYGDYTKWRDISNLNSGVTHLKEGDILQYEIPQEEFVWNPEGNPHLIQSGETLGSISRDKYGTPARWKSIYENNQPMIQDPDLIFAGFTLYYIPDREVASEGSYEEFDEFDF